MEGQPVYAGFLQQAAGAANAATSAIIPAANPKSPKD